MGCARFNVGFIVGLQNEISGLVRRVNTSSCTYLGISGGGENNYHTISQLPPVTEFRVLSFVSGKLTVVLGVLSSLAVVLELVFGDDRD